MFARFMLNGDCFASLNTEIRFLVASARVDNAELMEIYLKKTEDSNDRRILSCICKVLKGMMRSSDIQFYVIDKSLDSSETEAAFLRNKYQKYLSNINDSILSIYVKL